MKVDWSLLAGEMGTLIDSKSEIGGSDLGIQVIEHLLGLSFLSKRSIITSVNRREQN